MSKRLVLAGLALAVGAPMLASQTAPLGVLLIAVAGGLFSLPRLARREFPFVDDADSSPASSRPPRHA